MPLSIAVATAMGASASVQAIDFKVSGQVDRAIIAADNGDESSVGFVDNSGSNTRFRFTGEQAMDNGWTLGFIQEDGISRNTSSSWDIRSGNTNDHGDSFDIRWADIYVKTPWGQLSLGQGDGAANATSEVDLSGTTYLGGGVDVVDYLGGISLVDDDGNRLARLGQAYSHFDALSRVNRLRYDTPSFGPLSAAVSADEGEAYEGALFWASDAPMGKFAAQAGYADSGNRGAGYYCTPNINAGESDDDECFENGGITPNYYNDRDEFDSYSASASYLMDSGFSVTGSWSRRNYDGSSEDPVNYFAQVGYQTGPHHVAVSWGRTKDLLNDGSKADAYGASYVFDWTNAVQVFASYHLVKAKDLDNLYGDGDVDADDVNALFMGARVKFL